MIEVYDMPNDETLRRMLPAIVESDCVVEIVVPFSGGKAFYTKRQ